MLASQTYPDLFDGMMPADVTAVDQAVANAVLEGWTPTRDDIALLADQGRGIITADQAVRQIIEAARPSPVPAA